MFVCNLPMMLRSISPNNRYDLVLGGKSPPVICGVNTGQHMYLDASPSCNTLKIDVDTGTATTRQWQIKVDILREATPTLLDSFYD